MSVKHAHRGRGGANRCRSEAADASWNAAFVQCQGVWKHGEMQSLWHMSQKKCQDRSQGLCLPQIRCFEPWPRRRSGGRVKTPRRYLVDILRLEVELKRQNAYWTLISPSVFRVKSGFLSKDTCMSVKKSTSGIIIIGPNSTVNISWFYFALFVLVCDERAVGKQLSIIHFCSTASSEFRRNGGMAGITGQSAVRHFFVLS